MRLLEPVPHAQQFASSSGRQESDRDSLPSLGTDGRRRLIRLPPVNRHAGRVVGPHDQHRAATAWPRAQAEGLHSVGVGNRRLPASPRFGYPGRHPAVTSPSASRNGAPKPVPCLHSPPIGSRERLPLIPLLGPGTRLASDHAHTDDHRPSAGPGRPPPRAEGSPRRPNGRERPIRAVPVTAVRGPSCRPVLSHEATPLGTEVPLRKPIPASAPRRVGRVDCLSGAQRRRPCTRAGSGGCGRSHGRDEARTLRSRCLGARRALVCTGPASTDGRRPVSRTLESLWGRPLAVRGSRS